MPDLVETGRDIGLQNPVIVPEDYAKPPEWATGTRALKY